MYFNGYRFTHVDTSYLALHFANDFQKELKEDIPWWPSSIEEAWTEAITEIENDLIHSAKDQILIIGADADDIKDWSFLESLAATSPASCKILLCNDHNSFQSVKGFDAIIKTDHQINNAIHDFMWAIVSTVYCGLIGLDESDIITVIKMSHRGELFTFNFAESEKNWLETLELYQQCDDDLDSVEITGEFVSITLKPDFNFVRGTQDIVDISNRQFPKITSIIGGTVYPDSIRYRPKSIIRLIMY